MLYHFEGNRYSLPPSSLVYLSTVLRSIATTANWKTQSPVNLTSGQSEETKELLVGTVVTALAYLVQNNIFRLNSSFSLLKPIRSTRFSLVQQSHHHQGLEAALAHLEPRNMSITDMLDALIPDTASPYHHLNQYQLEVCLHQGLFIQSRQISSFHDDEDEVISPVMLAIAELGQECARLDAAMTSFELNHQKIVKGWQQEIKETLEHLDLAS